MNYVNHPSRAISVCSLSESNRISYEYPEVTTNGQQHILTTLRAMDRLKEGEVLKITTDGSDAINTLQKLYRQMGHELLAKIDWNGEFTLLVKKAASSEPLPA